MNDVEEPDATLRTFDQISELEVGNLSLQVGRQGVVPAVDRSAVWCVAEESGIDSAVGCRDGDPFEIEDERDNDRENCCWYRGFAFGRERGC